MRQDDGGVKREPLKNSQKFSTNKSDLSSAGLVTAVLMKKKGEEFLPGDLVFAQFPGYSWPALVTQVGAKNLEVVTLVLEQDEMIDKDSAVIFRGMDQLKQIMSVLTPGEQQDFSEASNSLMELSVKSRQERLDIIKIGRSDSDEGEGCKENKIFMTENESPVSECPKSPPKLQVSPKKDNSVDANGVKEIKKLSCDIDDISLPIVGSRLEKIIDQPTPRLTLEVGIPNFGPLDPLPSHSEGESEIEVKLNKSSEILTSPDKGASPSKRKKLQVKQQRDEDFITNAVKLTNKLFQTGAPSVELVPGHHLSYDSLKIARERAMAIAGCASPIISRTRRRSASKSTETTPTSEDLAAKAHAEHLKATRAAQKKALKSIGKPLEIVQTTVKNPSKRPGRKSSTHANSGSAKVAAEIAFIEAAEKLAVNADEITSHATDPEMALAEAAKEAAQQLVSINQQVNISPLKSPARKRRLSKRQCSLENNNICEIIVNSKSVEKIQKTLSPQKIVSPSALQESELIRSEKIKAVRCESLKRAREIKMQRMAEKQLLEQASPKAKSNRKSSKSLSVTSPVSSKLIDESKKQKTARISGIKRRSRRSKNDILDEHQTSAPEKERINSPSRSSVTSPSEIKSESSTVMEPENTDGELLSKPNTRRKSKRVEAAILGPIQDKDARLSRNKCCNITAESLVKTEEMPTVKDETPASTDEEKQSNSMEDSDEPSMAAKSNPVDEPGNSNSEIINFLCPYYLNLFTNVIKEKIESQIKLDLEKLPQEEHALISNLVDGRNRSTRKQAYEIISKLVKNSPCQNLLTSNLPEVGPGTPPASPKTEGQRISNKVIPQTRKRNSNSNCHEVVHNPFPVETTELSEKARKKYVESGDLPKKHSVIPRTWSQYLKNNGRFVTDQSKPSSVADKLKSPPSKSSGDPKPQNKRKKTDSPQSIKKEKKIELPADCKMMALLFYVKDIQINLSEPFKLKQSEVKWTDLSCESQNKYIELCQKLNDLSADEKTLECTALDLFVRSTTNISRLDWLSLSPTKHKKFLREAKKMTKKTAASLAETNEFSEKLVNKLINAQSRKRKRESQPVDTDSEPSSKKEKSDDTLLDFFCMDCFTLDYNPKQYATCHGCHASFHKTCLESQHKSSKQDNKQRLYCRECQEGPVCLLCRKGNNLKSCSQCPYKYHESCVTPHMSTQVVSSTSFICPYHVCGSCEARPELNIKNFVRCVRCPQSFHHNHIPAGCMRISRSHILCFRHYQGFGKKPNPNLDSDQKLKRKRKSGPSLALKKGKQHRKLAHLNVPFCFQCTFGGELICCEGCPASFHNECVPEENQIKEGEMSWLCPDCIVGKKPFIGDIVWVKFGAYRWWPCQVLDELDLPDNIFSRPHKPCQFPAICLGTKEFAWLDMSRVYSYEDGDKGSSSSNGMSASFKLAIVEAKDLHAAVKPIKETLLQQTESIDRPSTKKPAPFKFIRINTPYNSAMKEYEKQLKLERMPFPCDCTMADKCSADSSCINRVLLTECPTGCIWGDQCENQRFQRRQYPSTKLVKTEGRGWGLVLNEDVTQGTLVHEYVGEIIDEQEVQNRLQHYQVSGITDYYMLTVENSRIIDAKPKANNARFMNHSCDPNCETQKWNVLGLTCIGLFAKRDIKAGEELTFDYQFDTRGQEKKACLCGSANCSGFLGVPAKKMIEPTSKEAKKKPKKKRRKKPAADKKSISSLPSQESPSEEKSVDKIAGPENSTSNSKAPKKIERPSAKKEVSLSVRSNRKQPVKGIKSSTKRALKNTILSKRRTKAEENDIEDDLQKINAIVRDVEGEGSGNSQPEK